VPRRLTLAVLAAACLLLPVRAAPAQDLFPSHDVSVHLTLGDDGKAEVSQEYALTGGMDGALFQFLSDPCSTVGPVFVSIDSGPTNFGSRADVRGPWRFLHLDPAGTPSTRGSVCRVRYEVSTHGTEAVVPIVMPAARLDAAEGTRGARVEIVVRWTGAFGGTRVMMPRLSPIAASNLWEGRMLAMPSSVRVDLASATAGTCERQLAAATGGLEWRFVVFVVTMAVWVPAYLWWFGRRWLRVS